MHLGKQAGKQTEQTEEKEIEWIRDKKEADKQTNSQTDADQVHLGKQIGKQTEQTVETEIEWIRDKTGMCLTICNLN